MVASLYDRLVLVSRSGACPAMFVEPEHLEGSPRAFNGFGVLGRPGRTLFTSPYTRIALQPKGRALARVCLEPGRDSPLQWRYRRQVVGSTAYVPVRFFNLSFLSSPSLNLR